MLYYKQCHTMFGFVLSTEDAYDHLRRSYLTFLQFPQLAVRDYLYGFPHSTFYNAPGLWNLVLAFPAWLILPKSAPISSFTGIAIYVPPVIGSLMVAGIYFWANETFGMKTAVVAATLAVIFPGLVEVSRIGNVDRHVFETLWIVFALALFIASLKRGWPYAVVSGLCVSALFFTWLGAPLIIGFWALFSFLATNLFEERSRHITLMTTTTFGVSAALLIMAMPFKMVSTQMVFERLSALHVTLLIALSAAFILLGFFIKLGRKTVLATTLVTVIVLSIVTISYKPLFEALQLGAIKGLGLYPLAQGIAEWQPLFLTNGAFVMDKMFLHYGISLFLLVIAIPVVFSAVMRKREPETFFFFCWLLAFLFLGLLASYYFPQTSLVAVISIALLMTKISDLRFFHRLEIKGVPEYILVLLSIVITASLYPATTSISSTVSPQMIGLLKDIASSTALLEPYAQNKKPPYSIMSPWTYGQYIVTVAERPSVATGNFESNFQGFVDQQRFFQATSEGEALKIARRDNVRYVFVGPHFSYCIGDATLANPNLSSREPFFVFVDESEKYPWIKMTLIYRLLTFGEEGSPENGYPPLKHFRRVMDRVLGPQTFTLYELI